MTDSAMVLNTERRFMLYPQPDSATIFVDTAGTAARLAIALHPLWIQRPQYELFSAKAKIHFETPDDAKDFNATIRMKKDSLVWVDIWVLGGIVHAVRAIVTHDSAYIINYPEREFTKIPLSAVAKILPTELDLPSIQNLITGAPLRGGTLLSVQDMVETWLVKGADSAYAQEITYNKADSNIINAKLNTLDPLGPQATIQNSSWQNDGMHKLPTLRKMDIVDKSQKFYIEMELQNVEWEGKTEFPFNVPKNYKVKQ